MKNWYLVGMCALGVCVIAVAVCQIGTYALLGKEIDARKAIGETVLSEIKVVDAKIPTDMELRMMALEGGKAIRDAIDEHIGTSGDTLGAITSRLDAIDAETVRVDADARLSRVEIRANILEAIAMKEFRNPDGTSKYSRTPIPKPAEGASADPAPAPTPTPPAAPAPAPAVAPDGAK